MSVGFPQDKGAIDARAGSLSVQLRDLLVSIQQFETFLSAKPDADLTALGYTTAEVATLKSAFQQLDQLRLIATAGATTATVNNFLFFSNQLCGTS